MFWVTEIKMLIIFVKKKKGKKKKARYDKN